MQFHKHMASDSTFFVLEDGRCLVLTPLGDQYVIPALPAGTEPFEWDVNPLQDGDGDSIDLATLEVRARCDDMCDDMDDAE